MMDALGDLFRAFEETPQPVVAVVQGAALGGGCELVLGCDLCIAGERATFGQPEIQLGVFAPPATVLLPRIVGARAAAEMLLAGQPVPAAEARRIGLVNAVFPDDRLEPEAEAWIGRLLRQSGAALRLAKRAIAAARQLPLREAHRELHRIYLSELMITEDAREGLASFMEKRPPSWKHR
jgi:cyclohexa-1,5-dienecarbonyl-CoA hydratase